MTFISRVLLLGLLLVAACALKKESPRVTEDLDTLEQVAAKAFASVDGKKTLAFLVAKGDKVLIERYAPGTDAATPHRVFSAGQLLFHALVGNQLLKDPDFLGLKLKSVFNPWPSSLSPELSLEDILRLSSGIRYPFDREAIESVPLAELPPVPNKSPLQVRYPELLGVSAHPPGTRYNFAFMDRNLVVYTLIEHLDDVEQTFHREVGDPLGLTDTTLRFNFGNESSAAYPVIDYTAVSVRTSARDLHKILTLYLNGGLARGQRIFPADWPERSRSVSPGQRFISVDRENMSTDAFGLFWCLNIQHPGHGRRFLAGAPDDLMMIRGHKGQFLAVIPSQQLIFIRLGDDEFTSPKFSRALLAELLSL